jgi:metal-responsive CopG/Arc/MetJ family transcriptional regulator
VPARLSKALLKALDRWAKAHAGGSRSEAIRKAVRRLIEPNAPAPRAPAGEK